MKTNINLPLGIIHAINTYKTQIKSLQECPIVIAIDGHSSCGKSTLSKDLAKGLGYKHIDTGAMYRAVTYYLINHKIDIDNIQSIIEHLPRIQIEFENRNGVNRTLLNAMDIEEEIRGLAVAQYVSQVASISPVRKHLVAQQRLLGRMKGVVMDGRDIGSVVFPDAELKIFMTASPEVRANRRYTELKNKGSQENFETILKNLQMRDQIDSTRDDSPLVQVPDAKVIDTSQLTRSEQLVKALELAISAIN